MLLNINLCNSLSANLLSTMLVFDWYYSEPRKAFIVPILPFSKGDAIISLSVMRYHLVQMYRAPGNLLLPEKPFGKCYLQSLFFPISYHSHWEYRRCFQYNPSNNSSYL